MISPRTIFQSIGIWDKQFRILFSTSKFYFVWVRFKRCFIISISMSLLYNKLLKLLHHETSPDSQSVPCFCLDNPLGTQRDISSFSPLLSFLCHVFTVYYNITYLCPPPISIRKKSFSVFSLKLSKSLKDRHLYLNCKLGN